jgi:hypothetical protein
MSVTATSTATVKSTLDQADPNKVSDALRKVKLGTCLTPLKRVFASLTAAASFDLTLIDGTGETSGIANTNRMACLCLGYLRVDASGTAGSVGNYIVGPPTSTLLIPPGGANAAVGVARLSDDGKTITFPNTITGFTISYIPRSYTDMTSAFEV